MSKNQFKKQITFFKSIGLPKDFHDLVTDWILQCSKIESRTFKKEFIDIDAFLEHIQKKEWSDRINLLTRKLSNHYKTKQEIYSLFENFANYEEFSINILGVEILERLLKLSTTEFNLPKTTTPSKFVDRKLYIPKLNWVNGRKTIKNEYNWPNGRVGLHSSWNNGIDPRSSLSKTSRRVVCLQEIKAKKIWSNNAMSDIPLFFKNPNGGVVGLSSGAGGALVALSDKILKYKRCGYKEGFSHPNPYIDRLISIQKGSLYQKYIETQVGFHDINLACSEVEAANRILSIGCRLAAIPSAVFQIQKETAVLVQDVESDLRLDELLLGLTNREKSEIARASGQLYGFIHAQSMLRGIGNSWISNDVLMPDGTIGLADVENSICVRELSISAQSWLKSFEKHFYCMACVNGFDIETAESLILGFGKGYSLPNPRPSINQKLLLKILWNGTM